MMVIDCCKGCVPPKRHTGCHSDCPEYLKQKAEYDRLKEEDKKRRGVISAIYSQRDLNVYKAKRHRMKRKKYSQ